MYTYIYIYTLTIYHIIINRFKEPKSGPPPTTHHQNKKKVFALKSEILIKYKRVNQMDPTRETLRLFASQEDKVTDKKCRFWGPFSIYELFFWLVGTEIVNQMDPTRETLRLFAPEGDNLYIFNIELEFSDW